MFLAAWHQWTLVFFEVPLCDLFFYRNLLISMPTKYLAAQNKMRQGYFADFALPWLVPLEEPSGACNYLRRIPLVSLP